MDKIIDFIIKYLKIFPFVIIVFFFIYAKFSRKKYRFNINKDLKIIDSMEGREFEKFISILLKKLGYKTKLTKASNDQGVDIIAQKGFLKIGVQTKRYKNSVGNKAVQEIAAGKNFYKCKKGMVVTNSYFTKSAISLAKANNIELWDRNVLVKKLKKSKIKVKKMYK